MFSSLLRAITPSKMKKSPPTTTKDTVDSHDTSTTATIAAAAPPAAAAAASSSAPNETMDMAELWKCLDRELRVNIGTSVKCGICLSTIVKPMRTPCVHSFCRDCVLASLHTSNKCPECKTPISRRSLQPFDYLEELATNYKQLLVEFGFCPSTYTSSFTTLTQKPVHTLDDDVTENSPQLCKDRLAVAMTWQQKAIPIVQPPPIQVQENKLVVQANQKAYQQQLQNDNCDGNSQATTMTNQHQLPDTQEVQDQAREQQMADHLHEEEQEENDDDDDGEASMEDFQTPVEFTHNTETPVPSQLEEEAPEEKLPPPRRKSVVRIHPDTNERPPRSSAAASRFHKKSTTGIAKPKRSGTSLKDPPTAARNSNDNDDAPIFEAALSPIRINTAAKTPLIEPATPEEAKEDASHSPTDVTGLMEDSLGALHWTNGDNPTQDAGLYKGTQAEEEAEEEERNSQASDHQNFLGVSADTQPPFPSPQAKPNETPTATMLRDDDMTQLIQDTPESMRKAKQELAKEKAANRLAATMEEPEAEEEETKQAPVVEEPELESAVKNPHVTGRRGRRKGSKSKSKSPVQTNKNADAIGEETTEPEKPPSVRRSTTRKASAEIESSNENELSDGMRVPERKQSPKALTRRRSGRHQGIQGGDVLARLVTKEQELESTMVDKKPAARKRSADRANAQNDDGEESNFNENETAQAANLNEKPPANRRSKGRGHGNTGSDKKACQEDGASEARLEDKPTESNDIDDKKPAAKQSTGRSTTSRRGRSREHIMESSNAVETAQPEETVLQPTTADEDYPSPEEDAEDYPPAMEDAISQYPVPAFLPEWSVGTIVNVQSRTWPGVNKPGGVARITRINPDQTYNVSYVLGGRESNLDAVFLSSSEGPSKRKRAAEELPNSLLVALAAEGFDTARAATKRSLPAKTKAAPADKEKEAKTSDSGKKKKKIANALKDSTNRKRSKSNNDKTTGKKAKAKATVDDSSSPATNSKTSKTRSRKASPSSASLSSSSSVETNKSEPSDATTTNRKRKSNSPTNNAKKAKTANKSPARLKIPDLTRDEACKLANERYQAQFQAAVDSGVVHVVASNLPDADMDILRALCSKSLAKDVRLKLDNNIGKKTNVCVIPADAVNPQVGLVSRLRTAKAMGSALAGIPIVSPSWIKECGAKNEAIFPSPLVRSLPTKATQIEEQGSNHFGVAKLAANIHRFGKKALPLAGHEIHLCGAFAQNKRNDISKLAKEAGAKVVLQAADISGKLQSRLKSNGGGPTIVLACQDKPSGNLIPAKLEKEIMLALEQDPSAVFVVDPSWIFESITCGKALEADAFPLNNPKAKELWQLAINRKNKAATS